MGRTIPSFRIALAHEEEKWKLFRDSLAKSEKEQLDKIFLSAKFYISACMMSKIPVRIYPIMMSVLLYQYKQLLSVLRELEDGNISKR
jgi:hypothetical protein